MHEPDAFPTAVAGARAVAATGAAFAERLRLRIQAADATAIAATGVFAYMARHDALEVPGFYVVAILLAVLVHHVVARLFGPDRLDHPALVPAQAAAVVSSLAATFLILALVAYTTKQSDQYSRLWAALWWFGSLATVAAGRVALTLAALRDGAAGQFAVRTAVIAPPDRTEAAAREIVDRAGRGLRIVGIVASDDLDRLAERLSAMGAEEVMVVGPIGGPVLRAVRGVPLRVQHVLDPSIDGVPGARLRRVGAAAVVEVLPPPMGGAAAVVKRAEDLVLAVLILPLALPLILLAAAAVKAQDGGPVFFRQRRRGFLGEEFEVLKIRTMTPAAGHDPRAPQARRGDPRVTPVGRFLRRWSLDELPQIFNVLRGDMSLVGPRPLAVPHDDRFAGVVEGFAARRRMKPGVTGWAQANGLRGEVGDAAPIEVRLRHDLDYVEHWSIGFDLWILVLTAVRVIDGRNAA